MFYHNSKGGIIVWDTLARPDLQVYDPYAEKTQTATVSFSWEQDDAHLYGMCNHKETARMILNKFKDLGYPVFEEPRETPKEEQRIEFLTSEDGDGFYLNVYGVSEKSAKWVMQTIHRRLHNGKWKVVKKRDNLRLY